MANGKTVKVLGSGPLAGEVWYGTFVAARTHWVALRLDEPGPFGYAVDEFDPMSGALLVPDGQGTTTDLLYVDPTDMPRFGEMATLAETV